MQGGCSTDVSGRPSQHERRPVLIPVHLLALSQAPPAASGGHHQAQQHEDLLQQMARVEMQREAERAAQLAACGSDGDRRRLATLYELERQQAMHLMQRLSV